MVLVRMEVLPDRIPQFEESLKAILRATHGTDGHISSCVVKPKPGDFCYHTIVRFVDDMHGPWFNVCRVDEI